MATYAVISLYADGPVAPDWTLGLAAGIGGLAGGWVGASIQPSIPEAGLRRLLGVLALMLACWYLIQSFT